MSQDSDDLPILPLAEEGTLPPFSIKLGRPYALSTTKDVLFNKEASSGGGDGGDGGGVVLPKYSLQFSTPYKERTNFIIRFNPKEYIPIPPEIEGLISLKANPRITGTLFLEERPRFPIEGAITLSKNPKVYGIIKPFRVTRISGVITLNGFTLSAEIAGYTPYYLEGGLTLSSSTTTAGQIDYKDDVFRGLSIRVQAPSENPTTLQGANKTDYYRVATPFRKEVTDLTLDTIRAQKDFSGSFTKMNTYRVGTSSYFSYGVGTQLIAQSCFAEALRYRIYAESIFSDAVKLNTTSRLVKFTDLIRIRSSFEEYFSEAVKVVSSLQSGFSHGLPLRIYTTSYWRNAVKLVTVFKRKPVVPPEYEQPKAEDFNLRFKCRYRAKYKGGDFNIYFGMTRCKKPYIIPPEGTYMTENSFSAKRLADGQPFSVLSCAVDTDLSSWCWSGNFVIPASHLEYVKAISGQLPLVELTINGDQYVILVESFNRSRKFNDDTYTVKGRSLSALLDEPHSSPISYTNETEISAVQLVQQLVADTVGDTLTVYWADLVSDIGWVLPPESVSFSNQSVIKAIASIVEPVGGMVFTHPSQPVIVIKKVYPYAHWETPLVIDHTLAEDIIEDEGTTWTRTSSKNGVYVVDPITGDTVKVLRRGTAGELLDTEVNSPIVSTHEARVSAGKHALIKANTAETRSLAFPFLPQMHHLYPADILCVTTSEGQDWGTINSVGINVAVDEQGYIDVNYAVGVTRFMETGLYG